MLLQMTRSGARNVVVYSLVLVEMVELVSQGCRGVVAVLRWSGVVRGFTDRGLTFPESA